MKDFIVQFWPQITIIILLLFHLTKQYFYSGQERVVKVDAISAILKFSFEIYVVVCGGYFNSWHTPQYIYTILFIFIGIILIGITIGLTQIDKKDRMVKHRISHVSWTDFVVIGLLYWGGFFDNLINWFHAN